MRFYLSRALCQVNQSWQFWGCHWFNIFRFDHVCISIAFLKWEVITIGRVSCLHYPTPVSRNRNRSRDEARQRETDVGQDHSVREGDYCMTEMMQVNVPLVVLCQCKLNSRCRAVHIFHLNIFELLHILPPQAAAQAKAEPKPAVIDGFGLACRLWKPEPLKARPKPRLSGQAGPEHH